MKKLHKLILGMSATLTLAGAGCIDEGALPQELAPDQAPQIAQALLTTSDVDVAVECQGILGYVNSASVEALDAYLPLSVANAIVARRATSAFVSLADLSSVSGIAQARLAAITNAARTANWIDADCAGVYEELAVSADDRAAILTYVNTTSQAQLTPVLRFDKELTAAQLVLRRPFSDLQTLVDTYGVGLETFRSIRNAAIVTPFDLLVDAVNAAHRNSALSTAFDWYDEIVNMPGQPTGLTCFGIDPAVVAIIGGDLRPNLANGAEVIAAVTQSVNYANRNGQLPGVAAGMADLASLVDGQTFAGCYLSFAPNPWGEISRAFFINTQTKFHILAETSWFE
ncbi:MAG: hypothetical protein R3B48_14125 [Kofleriaceae bacterium]